MGNFGVFVVVFAAFFVTIKSVVIRNWSTDMCGDEMCSNKLPTCTVEGETEGKLGCKLLDKGNVTMFYIIHDVFEVHYDCKVNVLKVRENRGSWTEFKNERVITWSSKTEGKLFRVFCGGPLVYIKFLGVDRDTLTTPSPRPFSTTNGQNSTQVMTTKMTTKTTTKMVTKTTWKSSTVAKRTSSGATQMPKREHGHWYVGVGVGIGVVVVLSVLIVIIYKRKKRGVVYGGIELGSINGASEEETPL